MEGDEHATSGGSREHPGGTFGPSPATTRAPSWVDIGRKLERGGEMTAKIVVGVDGSQGSARAVEWCASHAKALDAEVVVVHAIEMPVHAGIGLGSPYLPTSPLSERQRTELHDHACRVWCAPLTNAGAPFHVVCKDGRPSVVIAEIARREEAELVVTGRRGRGGFAELLLGSTSHELAQHLDRPLLIVPRESDAE
jgi:nucleotide-binding universal stress UspA family protein